MKTALASIMLIVTAVASVRCQQTTVDFSGKWTMVPGSNQPPSAVRIGVGGLGEEFTVVQNPKTLTITNTLPLVGELKTVYN